MIEIDRNTEFLVTGGLGFIGSDFIRELMKRYPDNKVINLDAITYAGNPSNLIDIANNPNYDFRRGDIRKKEDYEHLVSDNTIIVNFAAESHVDVANVNPDECFSTNIGGIVEILKVAKHRGVRRVFQISTDEVYGALKPDSPKSVETHMLNPTSVYSSSKAAAEHIAGAFCKTFGIPIVISRSSNNYGPYQHPEKFIPRSITNLIDGRKIPLMGEGKEIRDWIHVEDNVDGLITVMEKGVNGETYNLGGGNETTNKDIALMIVDAMGLDPSWIGTIAHRPGHDFRYALDSSKAHTLGWKPKHDFRKGIEKTVHWYQKNEAWWREAKEEVYRREREAEARRAQNG